MLNKRAIKTSQKDFESIKKIDADGAEYWEARDLMPLLDYSKWSNFEKVVIKAKKSCSNSGQDVENHFADVGKMVSVGYGNEREVYNIKLSRYACYLIAQNGDSRKKAVANAQTYFAIQTRKQELFEQLDSSEKRLFIRGEIKDHNKKLFSTARKAGVSNFGKFNEAGYVGLYGMRSASVKKKKNIGKDSILDRAGSTELAANLFRITQTEDKLRREKIQGEGHATFAHTVVGQKVRKSIKDIGGTMPEDLAPEEHIKKVEQKRNKSIGGRKSLSANT